jgi:hypothetical protein
LYYIIDSDHRALFIDIDIHLYLKGIPSTTESASIRGIQSTNPRAVKKYQNLLQIALQKHKIVERMQHLSEANHEQQGLNAAQIEEFRTLEDLLTKGKLAAEKSVEHIPNIPWSPSLMHATQLVKFWYSWQMQHRHGRDRSEYRQLLMNGIFPEPQNPTQAESEKNLKQAKKAKQQVEKNAQELQMKHLHEMATMYANSGSTSNKNALRNIIKSESSRNIFRRAQQVLEKTIGSTLSFVLDNGPN